MFVVEVEGVGDDVIIVEVECCIVDGWIVVVVISDWEL